MRILDRYILKELVGPFLNGVVAFAAILTAGFILPRMVELLTGPQPLSLAQAGIFFLYRLPSILVITFPMSTLLGSLQGFGRLSADSETIVMLAGGISFARMMRWVFILGVLISLGTLWFNESLVPAANTRAQNIIRAAGEDAKPTSALVLQDWSDGEILRLVVAQRFDTRTETLHQVTMLQYNHSKVSGIVWADSANWDRRRSAWTFNHGYIQQISPNGPVTRVPFEKQVLALSKRPEEVKLSERKAEEMTYEELREYIRRLSIAGVDVRKYLVALQQKLSLPLACLVFILIGAPLGLRPHRGGAAIGFGVAIMIAFFYYVIAHFLAAAGEGGSVSPAMAAWLPDIVGAVVGLGLILKATR